MELWSVNRLAEQTGKDRRTVKKLLAQVDPADYQDGNEKFPLYRGQEAFAAIYEGNGADDKVGRMAEYEARILAAKADKEEIERDEMLGKLIELAVVSRVWEDATLTVKTVLRGVPAKLKSQYYKGMDERKFGELLEVELDGVETELSKKLNYSARELGPEDKAEDDE
jgi:phage terminase Nu1 subunit (DNA packaging protein)